MAILFLDTTSELFIMILSNSGDVIDKIAEQTAQISEKIIINIDKLMKRNQIEKFDIAAVNVGPGSFVGTRAGIVTIMGMRSTLQIPIITLSNMEMIAFSALQNHVHTVLYSHQNMFYVQEWNDLQSKEMQMISQEDLLEKLDEQKMIGDYRKITINHENFLYQPITLQQKLNLIQYKLQNKIFANQILQQHVKYK